MAITAISEKTTTCRIHLINGSLRAQILGDTVRPQQLRPTPLIFATSHSNLSLAPPRHSILPRPTSISQFVVIDQLKRLYYLAKVGRQAF